MSASWIISIVVLLVSSVSFAGAESGDASWDGLEEHLMACMDDEVSVLSENLIDFAKRRGKTKQELAEKLVRCVEAGLGNGTGEHLPSLSKSALWALVGVGGDSENDFVRNLMRSKEGIVRIAAIQVGIRMIPNNWEEWVREVATNSRFGGYDRYLAFKEAFRIGRDGDDSIRKHVVSVLKDMRASDPDQTNQNRLGLWITELEGSGWEEWMRKVVSEEGFYDADRFWAYELAFRTGMGSDEKTRKHVIDVLLEMRETDTFNRNRNQLDRWIEELKAR